MNIKKFLKKIFKEFAYNGSLVSFGAVCVVLTVILLLDVPVNIFVLGIPYFISQIIYTYNRFREVDDDLDSNPERTFYIKERRGSIKKELTIYCFLLVLFTLFTNLSTALFIIFFVGGGIVYTDYLKKFASKYIVGFKSYYASLFWALITFLVVFAYSLPITPFFMAIVIFVFYRVMLNAIFFDIKDIKTDSERNIRTFAASWGKKRTIIILVLLNIIFAIVSSIYFYASNMSSIFYLVPLLSVYSFYYLIRAWIFKGQQLRMLTYILVDAEFILWPIIGFIISRYV